MTTSYDVLEGFGSVCVSALCDRVAVSRDRGGASPPIGRLRRQKGVCLAGVEPPGAAVVAAPRPVGGAFRVAAGVDLMAPCIGWFQSSSLRGIERARNGTGTPNRARTTIIGHASVTGTDRRPFRI